MIQEETVFLNKQPLGRIFSDPQKGWYAFAPVKGTSPLPDREWCNVDELRRAIYEAYRPVSSQGLQQRP